MRLSDSATIRFFYLGSLAMFFLCRAATDGFAQEDEIAGAGKFLYQTHCASCHGVNAKGDGRMADILLTRPADLTQLRKRNSGQFPFWAVYQIIDGRREVRTHGPRAMPIWGTRFQQIEKSEATATGRILELVFYLKSIQEQ